MDCEKQDVFIFFLFPAVSEEFKKINHPGNVLKLYRLTDGFTISLDGIIDAIFPFEAAGPCYRFEGKLVP